MLGKENGVLHATLVGWCCAQPRKCHVALDPRRVVLCLARETGMWAHRHVFASFVLGLWVSFWALWESFGMVVYGRPACGLRLVGWHVGALVGIRYVVFDKREWDPAGRPAE